MSMFHGGLLKGGLRHRFRALARIGYDMAAAVSYQGFEEY